MMKLVLLFLFSAVGIGTVAQSKMDSMPVSPSDTLPNVYYSKPERFGYITHLPDDFLQLGKAPFQKKNLPGLIAVGISSAILVWQDEALLNGAKQLGRNIHLDPQTHFRILFQIKDTKIIKMPTNLSTVIYQMGEGGTSMLLAGGLYLYGKIGKDNRSLQTASDITETFFSMGIATQVAKRSFGRQSPFMATTTGGKWRPFPPFSAYQNNTSNYDAFPSGHLATVMATVTVLAENYPEKKWIKPLGYFVTGILAFSMMNSEVHWAGDYPLALALGYISGKVTVNRHKQHKHTILGL